MWMTPGQQVYIRDVSVIAYINMHWVVEEAPREGRVVLRAKIEEGDIEKLIRVKVEKGPLFVGIYDCGLCFFGDAS